MMSLREIPIDKIRIGEGVVRVRKIEVGLDKLKESIKRWGLLHPVVVFPKEDKYELAVGQRRFLACKELGWKTIPAMVISPLDAAQAKILSLTEHVQRRELSYADMVDAIESLYKRYGSIKAVAEALGVSESTVRRYLALRLAPEPLIRMIEEAKISKLDARRIVEACYPDEEKMVKLAEAMVKLTVSEKRRLVDISVEKPKASAEALIKEAKRPPTEVELVIHLPPKYEKTLRKAAEDLGIDYEDVLKTMIIDWLTEKGYIQVK